VSPIHASDDPRAQLDQLTNMRTAHRSIQKLEDDRRRDRITQLEMARSLGRFLHRYREDLPAFDDDNTMRTEVQIKLSQLVIQDNLRDGGLGPEMILIPHGNMKMGSQKGNPDEQPARQVQISRPFLIGRFEITFDRYDKYARTSAVNLPNDSEWGRGQRPVVDVSWINADQFANWLSEQTGKRYRLPTEAEWEFAARAGTQHRYGYGDDIRKLCEYANHADRYSGFAARNTHCKDGYKRSTAPVGQFSANAYGLFDLLGNVSEWVMDCYTSNHSQNPADGTAVTEPGCKYRIMRGGGWNGSPGAVRVSKRSRALQTDRYNLTGFRLVRDI